MAQATFPDGISDDIPKEKTLVEQVLEEIFRPMREYAEGLEKVNDYAAEVRGAKLEH